MQLIYLGSPYSNSDDIQKSKNVTAAQHCMAHFKRSAPNLALYSPIALWHNIAIAYNLSGDFCNWSEQDFFMIRKSSALWVLTHDLWKESYGLSQEMEYARDIAKPIVYVTKTSTGYVLTDDEPS